MNFRELPTPALVIDLDVLERNLDRMAAYCRQHGIGLRPHIKTHKTREVASMQLARGAAGLTVAKVGEAEVMAGLDAKQILVAYPIFGAEKLQRLAALTQQVEILIAVDHPTTAQAISEVAKRTGCELGILVEFDAGARRCGVKAGEECAELGRAIQQLPGLRLRGLMTFFGSVWGTEEERISGVMRAGNEVKLAVEAFRSSGLPLEIVSGGSTPAAELSHLVEDLTEIRPGTYVYNDRNTYYQGLCGLEDCAARVVTTVISNAMEGQAILDAGSKTLSYDALGSGPKTGYGHIVEHPRAFLSRLNEEHGYLDVSQARRLEVGEVVSIIPNHVCTCVNLHDEVFLIRNEEVIGMWNVAARGKIR